MPLMFLTLRGIFTHIRIFQSPTFLRKNALMLDYARIKDSDFCAIQIIASLGVSLILVRSQNFRFL